jgi:hypothetical protein
VEKLNFYLIISGMIFLSVNKLISAIFLWNTNSESCSIQSEQVRTGQTWPFERGCRWFQLFFIDFQLLAHLVKCHVSFCHHLASIVARPSVVRRKLSHFNILIRNHWANCNQTLVEWSLDGPLPKLCPVISTSNQDGRQAKNRKKMGDEILIVHCCFSISPNELKF